MPDETPDQDLSPDEIERRAGEIARRLLSTPPKKRPATKRNEPMEQSKQG